MIVESLALLVYAASGAAVMRAAGLRGWGLAPIGFLAGLALHICLTALLAVTFAPTAPVITLSADVVVAALAVLSARRAGRPLGVSWWRAGAVAAGIVAAVAALRPANLVRWHVDSLQYLDAGALLANGHYADAAGPIYVTKRLVGVSAIHEPARLAGEHYLTAVTPLMTVAGLAAIVWVLAEALRGRVSASTTAWFAGAAVVALLSTNRFAFHGFYLNGHMLTGMLLVAVAGCAWLVLLGRLPVAVGVAMAAWGSGALVVTRPEGALLAGLAVLPLVVAAGVERRARRVVLVALGGSVFMWQAFVVVTFVRDTGSPDRLALAQAVVGLAVVVAALLPVWALLEGRPRLWVRGVEAAMWVTLAALAVRSPSILVSSLEATWDNRLVGKWGYTVLLIAALVVAAAAAFRLPHGAALRLATTTFLPLVLLLAYARGGPYRVGHYDSLNRMWLHILPLATMYVAAALAAGEWRAWLRPVAARLGFVAEEGRRV